MEIMSLSIGFLVGAFTGAAATYLGNKFTDKRRESELKSANEVKWKDLLQRFPAVLSEMIDDVNNPEFVSTRKFFVKSSGTSVNFKGQCFQYHTDVHSDLLAAINYLEDLGFIEDVTRSNCPTFRMHEHFVDRLRNA